MPDNKKQLALVIACSVLVLLCAGAAAAVLILGSGIPTPTEPSIPDTVPSTAPSTEATSVPSTEPTTEPTTVPTEPPVEKIASATIVSMGDILMHGPVRDTYITEFFPGTTVGSQFDYTPVFTHIQRYISEADYAVINLETPLAGLDNGFEYSGVIGSFNAPDAIVEYAKAAGFDMLLTANNHTYDCSRTGLDRTLKVLIEQELDYMGTQQTVDEKDYVVKQINGISIGMICYTYETPNGYEGRKSLNGKLMSAEASQLVTSFDYTNLDAFYADVEASLAAMAADGAEATVLYIHWGDEYKLTQTQQQREIAQKLCDLGVDVIVGGHPHVVEPVELLTSTSDPSHKTVCLYSMGNAVSAQRRHKMRLNTGHTEDGLIFSLTFSKYSDGTVILEQTDVIPTWVNDRYQILPMDDILEDWSVLEISEGDLLQMRESYDRTMAIVGDGLADVQTYLEDHTTQIEQELGVTE